MKNIKQLIPTDKFDVESVKRLSNYSFEEIESIIPSVLEWLQDSNWPVSRPVGDIVKSMPQDKIGPYLMVILNAADFDWKFNAITCFSFEDKERLYPEFLKEIERIAFAPTELEIKMELQWAALHIVEK